MSNVPDTTTFNFQQVADAVYGDHNAGRNLVDAFDDADPNQFDQQYYGTGNDMLEFRNYGTFPDFVVLEEFGLYGIMTDGTKVSLIGVIVPPDKDSGQLCDIDPVNKVIVSMDGNEAAPNYIYVLDPRTPVGKLINVGFQARSVSFVNGYWIIGIRGSSQSRYIAANTYDNINSFPNNVFGTAASNAETHHAWYGDDGKYYFAHGGGQLSYLSTLGGTATLIRNSGSRNFQMISQIGTNSIVAYDHANICEYAPLSSPSSFVGFNPGGGETGAISQVQKFDSKYTVALFHTSGELVWTPYSINTDVTPPVGTALIGPTTFNRTDAIHVKDGILYMFYDDDINKVLSISSPPVTMTKLYDYPSPPTQIQYMFKL